MLVASGFRAKDDIYGSRGVFKYTGLYNHLLQRYCYSGFANGLEVQNDIKHLLNETRRNILRHTIINN